MLDQRVHADNYQDLRVRYAPWAPDTTDDWTQDCIARCIEPSGSRGPGEPTGTHYFASVFFPKSMDEEFTPERIKYLSMLDDDTLPYMYQLTHRGFGKTTLLVFAIMRMLLTRVQKYVLFTSGIYDVAAKRTEAIRAGIASPEVAAIFGDLKPKRGEHIGANFGEEGFILINPDNGMPMACVQPRGSEQVVNGSLVMLDGAMYRPTLIASDDGQKRLHIDNGEVRDRYVEWFDSEVMPVVKTGKVPDPATNRWIRPANNPMWTPPFRFMVIDTCKHVDAHIMRLVTNPIWIGDTFPLGELVDGKIKVRHKIMTQRELDSEVAKHKFKMDTFYREFMCRPSSGENKRWNSEMFQPFNEAEENFDNAFKFLVIDPARGVGFTSILAVAVKPDKGIFLRENIVSRLEPNEYYHEAFEMCRRTKTDLILVEETGLAMVIKNAFHQAASIAGLANQIRFDWLQSKRSPGVEYGTGQDAIKKARCAAMLPYYQQHLVWHEASMSGGPLERAQLQYPDCTFWDATDTAGYIPEIMERYEVYLDPKEGSLLSVDPLIDDEYEAAGEYFREYRWCS